MENIKFRLRIKVGLNNYFECFSVLATTSCESLVTWKKKKNADLIGQIIWMECWEMKTKTFLSLLQKMSKNLVIKKKNRKKKLNVTCELLFFEICPGKNLDRLCWLRRQWGWKFRKKYELKIKNLKIVQWNYIILK